MHNVVLFSLIEMYYYFGCIWPQLPTSLQQNNRYGYPDYILESTAITLSNLLYIESYRLALQSYGFSFVSPSAVCLGVGDIAVEEAPLNWMFLFCLLGYFM